MHCIIVCEIPCENEAGLQTTYHQLHDCMQQLFTALIMAIQLTQAVIYLYLLLQWSSILVGCKLN